MARLAVYVACAVCWLVLGCLLWLYITLWVAWASDWTVRHGLERLAFAYGNMPFAVLILALFL